MGEKLELSVPALQDQVAGAWQLAYVLTKSADTATDAAVRAFTQVASTPPPDGRFRIPLLFATRQAAGDGGEAGVTDLDLDLPTVTAGFWHLPGEERAALWLTQEGLGTEDLSLVLGVSADTATYLVDRAVDWLEVSVDQTSGPLCAREPKLPAYLRGELNRAETASMDRHIARCPTCRPRLEALRELDNLGPAVEMAVPAPPPGLAAQAIDYWKSQEVPEKVEEPPTGILRSPVVRALAACCGGLLLLGVLGMGVVRPVASASPSSPTTVTVAPSTTAPPTVPPTTARPTTSTTVAPPVTFPTSP
jgi:hypothetical protein